MRLFIVITFLQACLCTLSFAQRAQCDWLVASEDPGFYLRRAQIEADGWTMDDLMQDHGLPASEINQLGIHYQGWNASLGELNFAFARSLSRSQAYKDWAKTGKRKGQRGFQPVAEDGRNSMKGSMELLSPDDAFPGRILHAYPQVLEWMELGDLVRLRWTQSYLADEEMNSLYTGRTVRVVGDDEKEVNRVSITLDRQLVSEPKWLVRISLRRPGAAEDFEKTREELAAKLLEVERTRELMGSRESFATMRVAMQEIDRQQPQHTQGYNVIGIAFYLLCDAAETKALIREILDDFVPPSEVAAPYPSREDGATFPNP